MYCTPPKALDDGAHADMVRCVLITCHICELTQSCVAEPALPGKSLGRRKTIAPGVEGRRTSCQGSTRDGLGKSLSCQRTSKGLGGSLTPTDAHRHRMSNLIPAAHAKGCHSLADMIRRHAVSLNVELVSAGCIAQCNDAGIILLTFSDYLGHVWPESLGRRRIPDRDLRPNF